MMTPVIEKWLVGFNQHLQQVGAPVIDAPSETDTLLETVDGVDFFTFMVERLFLITVEYSGEEIKNVHISVNNEGKTTFHRVMVFMDLLKGYEPLSKCASPFTIDENGGLVFSTEF